MDRVTMGVTVEFDPGFLDYEINTGYALRYLAEQVLAVINRRTDKARDYKGRPFRHYADSIKTLLKRDKNGEIVRDAKGRWTVVDVEKIVNDRAVQLRSIKEMPFDKHMREHVIISPLRPTKKTKAVKIRPSGSRDGMSHHGRAVMVARQGRVFIDADPTVISKLMTSLDRGLLMAWFRKQQRMEQEQDSIKAQRKADKERRKALRKVKTAHRIAKAEHKKVTDFMQRNGVSFELDLKALKKTTSSRKRKR